MGPLHAATGREATSPGGLVATVSTVKGTAAELRDFTSHNLRRGVDHMFVFVDGDPAAADEALSRNEHVTWIDTTQSWWGENKVKNLNGRQGVNANLMKAVLSAIPSVAWLFHIDSDEVVDVDRDRLLRLPTSDRVVRLQPLEVASHRKQNAARPEFKRLLDDDELELLQGLGVINSSSNSGYFHGHQMGKSGVRPALDLNLGIHQVLDPEGEEVEGLRADWLRVLHLHCPDLESFVRRWNNLMTSGGQPRLRRKRASTASAMRALATLDLPDRVRRKYLERLYVETMQDDIEVLRDLGLVETVDLNERKHTPVPMPTADLRAVESKLDQLRGVDKLIFKRGQPDRVATVL